MKQEKKTIEVKIRFSPTDIEAIRSNCEKLNVKRATWIRSTVMAAIEKEKENDNTMESDTLR